MRTPPADLEIPRLPLGSLLRAFILRRKIKSNDMPKGERTVLRAVNTSCRNWIPTIAQGMYHPQYFGKTGIRTIEVRE